ncbi:2,3-bisphosphoglycerate-dependent phosphoglycerate mutase [Methylobacterium sp. NEAU 140]|uniref:2,3-bisphosphoglycerate-dependent phosphoglycerate mutase n=1 Tax=Methylobacterium sp. NEAU 140 TaxID=3064945 RepID=UPI002736AD02|nr:2,3-bisphosphoglycerate-dependent phosphoglycerate mutase [Methylobacterium sp. NEAU 140]MDP4026276.1 2,3-bisphosphoglycerate-dependent phosphoglycerate mutase [Methylobacterium sp. NEAU 140]
MSRALALVRHGQSTANAAGEFTGSRDVPLTPLGREQARAAGRRLLERGLYPDTAFCSTRTRTAESATMILDALGRSALPVEPAAALDERDYGALTGLTHAEAEARWGAEQVRVWRRAFADPPPGGESIRDTLARVAPYHLTRILPAAMRGVALVVAHGNSLRALVTAVEGLSPGEAERLEIPTGSLRLYRLTPDATIEGLAVLS